MTHPLISLITVVYNAEGVIRQTLQSALRQSYTNIEFVIVDGKSTDGTLEVVKEVLGEKAHILSEKDTGIYNAMNKGINMAKGDWVYFLNAGDTFYSDKVLENIFVNHADDCKGKDFIYAKVQTINEPTGINYLAGKSVTLKDFYTHYPICHQATFTHVSAFKRLGLYNDKYKLAADTEWFARYFFQNTQQSVFIDEVVAYYDIQGTTYKKRMQGYKEYLSFGKAYFPFWVQLKNVAYYPLLWCKVKFIRSMQHTYFFKQYRKLKFRHTIAHS